MINHHMAYAIIHFELDSNWLEHSQHSHVFCIIYIFAIEKSMQMQGEVWSNILEYYYSLKQNSCLVCFLWYDIINLNWMVCHVSFSFCTIYKSILDHLML